MKSLVGAVFLSCTLFAVGIPGAGALPDIDEIDGLVEPYRVVKVAASSDGVIGEIGVERGDRVKRDQVLARLDFRVEQASMDVARAKAGQESMIEAAQVEFEHAERLLKQFQEMHTADVISSDDFELIRKNHTLAQLAVRKARENKRIAELEYMRSKARYELGVVRSPIDGVVSERLLSQGELASRSGQPTVCEIVQLDPLLVQVHVPVRFYGRFRQGMEAEVKLETHQGEARRARVTIVDKVVDAASETFGVRLELPNPKWELPSGLHCKVKFLP